jgi:hypothetical protein
VPKTRTSGQGRPKGALNRENRDIREMIVGALCAVGGQQYLARQAEQNPVAFLSLVGKVLPLQLAGPDGNNPIILEVRWAPAAIVSEATNAITQSVIDAGGDDVVWQDAEC